METLKATFEQQVKAELTDEQISLYEDYLKNQSKQRTQSRE
jgi:hypothetical protein